MIKMISKFLNISSIILFFGLILFMLFFALFVDKKNLPKYLTPKKNNSQINNQSNNSGSKVACYAIYNALGNSILRNSCFFR